MRIIVWGINYAPELTGIGPYNTLLCDFLAEHGHEVEMVTGFPYYPEWQKSAGDVRRAYRSETIGAVQVHRCWLYVPNRVRALGRIMHEATFVISSLLRIVTLRRPDLYIVVSPPLLLGVAAAAAAFIKRTRFSFHVQDLQPDAALRLRMLRERSLVAMVLYRIEAIAYSRACRVSAISPGMLRRLRDKGIPEEKLVYFPNAVALAHGFPRRGAFRERNRISANAFLVVYSGNLGMKQGLNALLDAAVLLQQNNAYDPQDGRREIEFVIAGAGVHRSAIVDYISSHELRNIKLLPLQPSEAYHEMLVDADCCAITQQPGTGALFFPSKLLMTLAFGRAVLSIADEESDLAVAVRDGGFGANIIPGATKEVADIIGKWAASDEDVERMGRAGRVYVRRFETTKVLADFEAELRCLAAEKVEKSNQTTSAASANGNSSE